MKKLLIILLLLLTATAYGQQKPMLGRQLDGGNPLTYGLVGVWLMNEDGGTLVQDLSLNGNDGILSGTLPIWQGGNYGQALNWAAKEGVFTANTNIPQTNKFTVIFSVTDTVDASGAEFLQLKDSGSADILLWFKSNSAPLGRARIILQNDVPDDSWASYTSYLFWPVEHHTIAIVVDIPDNTIKMYSDGILQETDVPNLSGNLAAIAQVVIGGNVSMLPIVDYLYLYDRALTASEIADLYEAPFRFILDEDDFIPLWFAALPTDVTFLMQVQHGHQEPMLGVSPNWGNSLNAETALTFPINEGGGNVVYDLANGDSIGFGVTNTVWTNAPYPLTGSALDFDGAGDSGILNTVSAPLPHEKGSFSFWCTDNHTGGDGASEAGCYITIHDGSNVNRIAVYTSPVTDVLTLHTRAAGVPVQVWTLDPSPIIAVPGTLFHVVATWNMVADDYHVYLDGIEPTPTSTAAGTPPTGMNQVTLGAFHQADTLPLSGIIVQATVYNRVLTAEEADQLYNEAYGQYDYAQWFTTEDAEALAEFGQFIFIMN